MRIMNDHVDVLKSILWKDYQKNKKKYDADHESEFLVLNYFNGQVFSHYCETREDVREYIQNQSLLGALRITIEIPPKNLEGRTTANQELVGSRK